MRYARPNLLHYAIPVSVLALGALFLLPGSHPPERVASINEIAPKTTPSYLAASPEMVAELEASLLPAEIDESIIEREASRPDPSAVAVSTPVQPTTVQQVAIAATPAEAEPEASPDPATAIRVGDTAVNMRVGPSTSTAVIRPLQAGEALTYGESDGGWVSVTTETGETGWVYNTYLTGPALPERQTNSVPEREVAEARQPSNEGRYARVGSDVYLRAGPSQSTERLFVLPAGERVQVAETKGRWARVILPSGASGWVRVR